MRPRTTTPAVPATADAAVPSGPRPPAGRHRTWGTFSALLGVPLSLAVGGTAHAAAPAVVVPRPPTKTLPKALDVAPPYQPATRCLAGDLPGPVAFARLLNAHYGTHVYGVNRRCVTGEHGEGRAMDWMLNARTPEGLALGNAITRWLSAPDSAGRPGAMARRFGVMYIIWNRQMWRAYAPERGWTAYTGASPHTDHIHFSFTWDGAYRHTSWWTGVAVTAATMYTGPRPGAATSVAVASPAPTSTGYPVLRQGSTGTDVRRVQRIVGATVDGQYGPRTAAAVGTWQGRNGVKATQVVDDATWRRLIALGLFPRRTATSSPAPTAGTAASLQPYLGTTVRLGSRGEAVRALQRALGGLAVDGQFGPATLARVRTFQRGAGLPVTGVVATSTWKALAARVGGAAGSSGTGSGSTLAGAATASLSTEFTAHKGTVLRSGSRGPAVTVLQAGLGGLSVDGAFGTRTTAAVTAFQKAGRLPVTGIVDRRTWDSLEARRHPLLPHWGTVVRAGSRGVAVTALQRALRITADGAFGPATTTAVKAAQARARLAQTG
ncbi:MAG TPA: peptidoglycan-binding protein, partial [Dermatophilaceae bacterium]|nr:peptidoglycan-binding protein [Dermatophilaceae bacterium]